jgi:hypothetical protein
VRDSLPTKGNLLLRHSIAKEDILDPLANRHDMVHLPKKGARTAVSQLDQLSHAHGGPRAALKAAVAKKLS